MSALDHDVKSRMWIFLASVNLFQKVIKNNCEYLRKSLLHIVDVHALSLIFPIDGCVTVLQWAVLVHGLTLGLRHLTSILGCVVEGCLEFVLEDSAEFLRHAELTAGGRWDWLLLFWSQWWILTKINSTVSRSEAINKSEFQIMKQKSVIDSYLSKWLPILGGKSYF